MSLKLQPGWTTLSSAPILRVSGGRVRPAHYSAPSHTEDEDKGEVAGLHVVEGGDTRWAVVEVFSIVSLVFCRYYFGIIDIFTHYGVMKKMEHFIKSVQYDSTTISCIPPENYADRFYEFMKNEVFS